MAPGARNKFGATMFEPEVFRKQITVLTKVLVTFLGLLAPSVVILHQRNCALVTPLLATLSLKHKATLLHQLYQRSPKSGPRARSGPRAS